MKLVDSTQLPWKVYRHPREGTVEIKLLDAGSSGGDVNYAYLMVRYGKGGEPFFTPRHRHTFEQIRVPLEGALNYGEGEEIPQGWASYFPEGCWYGPQHVRGGVVLGVQFGAGYLSEEQKRTAHETMVAKGEFRDGLYVAKDPSSGKEVEADGMEALWEHVHGKRLEYRTPRYPKPILMDPEAFSWIPGDLGDGVERRLLGSFTERDVRIEMIRWAGDGSYPLSAERTQLAFLREGTGDVMGRELGPGAALVSERGETSTLNARVGTTMLVFGMPLVPPETQL